MDRPVYDLAVIGAGPGGYVAALRAAQRGLKVCCIESDKLGGACLNVGCIPTKTMLHASELFWRMGRAGEFGISSGPPKVDGGALMARVARVCGLMGKGIESLLRARKVDVVRGRGQLAGRNLVTVQAEDGVRQVQARSIILATGSAPVRPGFLPWDSGRVMTTDQATLSQALPGSVLVIGGGVIGCEFATFYSELGIPTTLVEMLDRLAANLDEDAGKVILRSLRKRGVNVLTGTKVVEATVEGRQVAARLDKGQSVRADYVLAAVGRTPNTADLGLDRLGIAMDGPTVRVDDRCRTNLDNIYAVGDLAERRQYAHLASRMGTVAADNAAGVDARDDRSIVPVGAYTHPEVAAVGLTEAQARRQDPAARAASFPYLASGIAQAYGQAEGLVKLVAAQGGTILGAVVVGPHATDVIHEVALAMRHGLGVKELAQTIHAHPTFSEAVGESAEAWLGLPVHVLGQRF